MVTDPPQLIVRDAAAWRTWLGQNVDEQAGVWLVLAKKTAPATGLRPSPTTRDLSPHSAPNASSTASTARRTQTSYSGRRWAK